MSFGKGRSRIVQATASIPGSATALVRHVYLEGRYAALSGDTETRDACARELGKDAALNGVVVVLGFLAASLNAYLAVRHGSPSRVTAATVDSLVGGSHLLSVYTQAYLRAKLATIQPATSPEQLAAAKPSPDYPRSGLGELAVTTAAIGFVGFTASDAALAIVHQGW